MIYLTTGANGAGKTLLTLKDVRAQQLKENRPVYYHGFDMDEAKAAEFGWQKFDPKDWQGLPDGSICIMDECQNEFPLRRSGSEVPEYVQAIAQHRRRRGFDFWMICPHPSLVDVFVRRLIDKPSWHRHLKRAFGADVVSVLRFSAPDMKCEEPGAGARGEVSMVGYPKEVYSWYRSASLHTGKRKIPRAVFVLAACAIAVPSALYFAITGVYKNATKQAKPATETIANVPGGNAPQNGRQVAQVMTAAEYVDHRTPRLKDFPQTAPAYDEVTKPTEAPYPAACVQMGKTCKCYTQQATLLQVSGAACLQIVQQGFFMDWKTAPRGEFSPRDRGDYRQGREGHQQPQQVAQLDPQRTVPVPSPAARPEPVQSQYLQGLAARNAQVRSSLTQ
ncbi:zona occludens toxin [Acidovorax sp. 107]|uniref:zonular occludens toxin domain-containing protein n=1 Tax=Acidovorax sp. 107 TaxID=2135638 RepID=UPI000D3D0496|nr:zonular occludens toxin domain-containing protein [Acidovorax sp. 107]PUA99154.1 zona occludens toxin [Acidovorax sp. 107]